MSTTYRASLGFLALVAIMALSLGRPLRAAAQVGEPVVAIDPPQVAVDPQATFSVAVTVADAPELRSYEFELTFDPAVVEVEAVEPGPFLENTSPVVLGPDIDNDAGTVTFATFSTGSGPWPSGSGLFATVDLRAVGEGSTAIDLRDVRLFAPNSETIAVTVEDGVVQVGGAELPTDTPTREPIATATPTQTATGTAAATEAATTPPQATATKTATPPAGATATQVATPEPTGTGTATRTPTSGATTPAEATAADTATRTPTPEATATATATGPSTEEGPPGDGTTSTARPEGTPTGEGSPGATGEPAEGEGIEPSGNGGDEAPEGGDPMGAAPWLILAAVGLSLAGTALIGVGVYAFGPWRRDDEEPVDDDNA